MANTAPMSLNRLQVLSGKKSLQLKKVSSETKIGSEKASSHKSTQYFLNNSRILCFQMSDLQRMVELSRLGHQVTLVHDDESILQKARNMALEFGEEILVRNHPGQQEYDALYLTKKIAPEKLEHLFKKLKKSGVLYYEAEIDEQKNQAFKSQELLKVLSDFRVLKYEESPFEQASNALFVGIK